MAEDTLILDGDPIIDINADGESEIVIAVGHEAIVRSISITENGHYEPDAGVNGFSSVDVNVKYQSLIDYINGATGGKDTTLSDAVETLVAGYGQDNGAIKTDSGTLYIDEPTIMIVVHHNLEAVPDFAYICVDVSEASLIPKGCCFYAAYGIVIPKGFQGITDTDRMLYIYSYRHQTSGEALSGRFYLSVNRYSDKVFAFLRGVQPWLPTDTNGDPMPYKWMVGRFIE